MRELQEARRAAERSAPKSTAADDRECIPAHGSPVRELRERHAFRGTPAKAGEEILVTDRGEPCARVVPLDAAPPSLMALAAEGIVQPGSGRLPRRFLTARLPKDAKARALRLLLSEREQGL